MDILPLISKEHKAKLTAIQAEIERLQARVKELEGWGKGAQVVIYGTYW
jgi:hypothetical protein